MIKNSDSSIYSVNLKNILNIVGFYYYAVFGSLGFVLNIVGIIGFSRKSFTDLSRNAICQQGFFNIVIAVVNNLCIALICLSSMPYFFGQNPFLWSPLSCILLNYLEIVSRDMSSWLDLVLAADRMICITFPTRFKCLKLKKVLLPIILTILLFIMGVHFESALYTLASVEQTNTSVALLACVQNADVVILSNVVLILMRVAVPFIGTIGSNAVLIYNLKKVKDGRYKKKEAQFAKSVIALNVLFLVSQLPYLILYIVKAVLSYGDGLDVDSLLAARVNFAYVLSQVITSYNYIFPTVVNFFFNKMFHEELLTLFGFQIANKSSNGDETSKSNIGTKKSQQFSRI